MLRRACGSLHLRTVLSPFPPFPHVRSLFMPQSARVAHFRVDFTTDGTDNTDVGRDASPRRPGTGRLGEPSLPVNSLSVKSVKSVVPFPLVAAGRARRAVFFGGWQSEGESLGGMGEDVGRGTRPTATGMGALPGLCAFAGEGHGSPGGLRPTGAEGRGWGSGRQGRRPEHAGARVLPGIGNLSAGKLGAALRGLSSLPGRREGVWGRMAPNPCWTRRIGSLICSPDA
jgi:hypothetical protein